MIDKNQLQKKINQLQGKFLNESEGLLAQNLESSKTIESLEAEVAELKTNKIELDIKLTKIEISLKEKTEELLDMKVKHDEIKLAYDERNQGNTNLI